ncbi:gem nuclear organelle associated protein rigor mortis [Megachile rotundata]|uniref:gem nuclear organelle associated protein rigor mortis n=1 Tax=Megachile rotundata TaxID=143995 RepID=UPI000614EE31|nr:PREDICTED: gem-associated protein 5-like [Megachile rotundata]
MNETTLPPSPNWYLSNIFACSFNGTVAWGARNVIVVVKPTTTGQESNNTLQYSIIKHAHKTKVTCVAFTPRFGEVNSNFIASTGDDNTIKIWNSETSNIANTYILKSEVQAIGIDWSYKDPFVIYSASSDGCVLSWNSRFDTVSVISLGKVAPTCLSSCPHDQYLVAVGSKSGLVYIVNFQGKGTIVYKLRGHDTEVVSLSWCPLENNVISGNMNKDLLLASGGRDRSVFIWRAGGDGRYEMTISLPATPLDLHHHRTKSTSSGSNWTVVHWMEPKLLLTNSHWGELISWDLSTISKHKPISKLIHACHGTGLFCISHVPIIQENLVENWRMKQRFTIWTVGQDRRVVCCNINENNVEIVHDIFTQSGYVYCIAACPLDTSRVAFGVGDAMLRVWNLSEAHNTTFDITVFWQKIKGKIRTISWHPEKENLLAYATEEGRIGMFNTNTNKPPTLYRQYHRNIVYTIGWGPNPDNKQYVLYSCAEGELVYYDAEKPNQEPKSVLKKECTEFSWKPDLSCLAVGFENGLISFCDNKFKTFGTAKFSSKMLHCLVWHPESTTTDLTFSPLKNYLAAAFESRTIVIFDLTNLMDHFTKLQDPTNNNEKENSDIYEVNEVVATLTGHIHNVVCLAWSPYISGHLISGSYDGIAQVWNVETQELIATYTGHSGPVLCCMWSPLNSNFIITGSADFTVRIWKVDSNVPQELTHQKASKKSEKKQIKANKVTDTSVKNNITNLTNTPLECSDVSQTTQKSKTVPVKEAKKKKSERTTYFTKNINITNNKTLVLDTLLNVVKTIKSEENPSIEGSLKDDSCYIIPLLFSKHDDFVQFLTNEKHDHTEKGKYDLVTQMDMWSDNLKQNLEEAAKEKRLSDFHVSLSASLSMKTWREMCELYAYQLVTQGNPHKAVSYLLCIHKTYKAIEVFQDANLYKEAYALARCKLEPDDPILTNVLQNWAKYNVNVGQFEEAAFIYAKLGDFSEVTKYLTRRKDPATLITAAEIALVCNDDTLSKSIAKQALIIALENSEYDAARNIISKFPYLKYEEVHLITLEKLEQIIKEDLNFDMVQTWIDGNSNYGLLQSLENICGDCSCYYTDLCQNRPLTTLTSEQMLWLTVSHEFALAISSTEKKQKLKHIVTGLHTVTQYETLNRKTCENQYTFLIKIVIKLDIKNLMEEESIYAKTDYPVSTSLRAYLCYAVLNWLVYNLENEVPSDKAQPYINLIENLLDDALNKQTMKHWTMKSEINKLENQITSILDKASDEDKDNQDTKSLIEELSTLKIEKDQVLNDLVYVPNPVMTYSKANELCSKLVDEAIKNQFFEILSMLWKNASL